MPETRLIQARVIRHTLTYCLTLVGFWILLATAVRAEQSPAPPDDLFAPGAWYVELGLHGAAEAWNYNISRENMMAGTIGVSYGLTKNVAVVLSAPLYYVNQRGPDAWLFGTTWGVRWRMLERRRVAVFLEVEVGISRADMPTPPLGTRFNYLALGGAGITTKVARGTHLLTGIKWIHVSNNGLAGPNRNPDIEAVGPRISVLRRF